MAQGSSNPTTINNVTKIAGTAVSVNSGAKDAGTQRVILASDQTSIPITDNSGSLTVDAPVATPVYVRLSDGSAAIATLPVSLATLPTLANVTTVGTVTTVTGLTNMNGQAIAMGSGARSAGTQRVTIATDDVVPNKDVTSASTATALGALNANISLDVSSNLGASMVVTAISTPVGMVLTPQISFDGGTTWVTTIFDNPNGDKEATIPNASLSVGLSRSIVTSAGATHVRILASSWTSGSATVQVRGTQLNDPSVLYGGANNSTNRPPVTAQVGGWDGANLRTLTTNASGHLAIQDGGNSITVDAPVATPVFVRLSSGSAAVDTLPVSAASLPLPTGAATAAKQPALGTAGTASADVITVQGVASMTALKVDGSAVTQPVSGTVTANAGTGSFTVAQATASSLNATVSIAGSQTLSTVTSLTQMNGQTISMGTGVRDAGTQRVTIATNDAIILGAGAAAIGSITNTTFAATQATPASLQMTATQAVGSAATRWYTQISDGTTSPAIKAASVAAATADPAMVVSFAAANSATKISDGTNTAAVKAASTQPAAADPALVVAVHPSNVVRIRPSELMRDPVDKLRVSEPQALIDTDFEYGTQPTKWESMTILNNRATSFYDNTTPIAVTAMSVSTKTVTVTGTSATFTISAVTGTTMTVTAMTTGSIYVGMALAGQGITAGTTVTAFGANTSGGIGTYTISASMTMTAGTVTGTPPVGSPVFVQGTFDPSYADGWWLVATSTGTAITYTTITAPAATLFDSTKTYVYPGTFYTGSVIPVTSISTAASPVVTTAVSHGLRPGNTVFIRGTTATTNAPNGNWVVVTTPTNNTFTFTADATPTGTIAGPAGSTFPQTAATANTLYIRPSGYIDHRAFDGGVMFSNKSAAHGSQLIRQTRRYFRYQSGKGIQFSTGTVMKPAFTVDRLTNSGTTITVTTKYPHGVATGLSITVSGATDSNYNGTFTITGTPTPTTFTYTAGGTPATSPDVGFPITVSPNTWYGGTNRVGMFDQQNGFYFEFDGATLYAVVRKSVDQISGTAALTNGSGAVTGTNTLFSKHLKPGDNIVIRGQSYTVDTINSDTAMWVYPEYKGPTVAAGVTISKTVNTRYAQSTWNIDRVDGTAGVNNPSGYNVNLARMQMFYADYSWYGAGAVRFGFKDANGEIIYCHRVSNTNVNTEAYMRSGNLPARYETNTLPYQTYLTATLAAATVTAGTISVADTTGWPTTGTVVIKDSSANGLSQNIEYISYSAKTLTSLTIGTGGTSGRALTGGAASAQTFTYSATAPQLVELYSPQAATTIAHWGSSVIMDGKFDDDKSFVFNAGMSTTYSNVTQGVRVPLISMRLGPSVDNGVTGLFGARELINRMQLTLRSMDAYTTGSGWRIEILLNARVSGGTWASVGGSSLAQIIYHGQAATVNGGESIYGFFTNQTGATSQDLNAVRDIGNSILGGGNSSTISLTDNNKYPDGPDSITICATPLTATNTINARISWTEAQA